AYEGFLVPMHPGDNIKIAAVCSTDPAQNQDYLNGVLVDGTDLVDAYGNVLSTGASASIYERSASSQMLTTWRRLHIEADSMGTVHGNFLIGKVASVGLSLAGTDQTTVYVTTKSPLENSRFERGRIVFDSSTYFKVLRNDTSSITVQGRLTAAFVGKVFQLFDDDDFNNNNGALLDGDEGEDIPVPDMSLVQDSDDPKINVFAPAYIRPTYDLAGN